jgi:hypothetical protein
MGKDTDGTNWLTVRFTVDISVMAEDDTEAEYLAKLALPDYYIDLANSGEVIG